MVFSGMKDSEDKAGENIPFPTEFFWSLCLCYDVKAELKLLFYARHSYQSFVSNLIFGQ